MPDPKEQPRTPPSKWTKRFATYPDAETARLLGDIYRPGPGAPKLRRPPVENRHWVKAEIEGAILMVHVLGDRELTAGLVAASNRLALRKAYKEHPGRPPMKARQNYDVANRRRYFQTLADVALQSYLALTPDPAPLFVQKPHYVLTAFKRLCVIEHFTRMGNPKFPRP